MDKQSTKFLTEIASVQGKGKGAMAKYQEEQRLRLIMNCSDFSEWEARTWWIGPSLHPSNKRKAQDIYEHELLSERIDQNLFFHLYSEFHNKLTAALLELKVKDKAQKHAGHELGPREFTLTYSPDWFEDDKAQFFMKQAIEKLCSYYETEIVYLRAVGERTKAGRVHIHCYYELERGLKMTDKNLKRAYHKWNSKHHHHRVVKKTSDFLGYIDKQVEGAWFQKTVDNRSTPEISTF